MIAWSTSQPLSRCGNMYDIYNRLFIRHCLRLNYYNYLIFYHEGHRGQASRQVPILAKNTRRPWTHSLLGNPYPELILCFPQRRWNKEKKFNQPSQCPAGRQNSTEYAGRYRNTTYALVRPGRGLFLHCFRGAFLWYVYTHEKMWG